MGEILEIDILRMGAMGDGVGEWQGKQVFVPFVLPGERIRALLVGAAAGNLYAHAVEWLEHSPLRAEPPCRHFTRCGGCELQHLSAVAYRDFKQGIALQVARRLALNEGVVAPLVVVPPHSRRRVEVKVAVAKGVVALGYYEARSHQIVDVQECPVADPDLVAVFQPWREAVASLKTPGNVKNIHFTKVEGGLDVVLQVAMRTKPNDRDRLSAFAASQPILRLQEQVGDAAEPGLIYRRENPVVYIGPARVEIPAGAFLQATAPSQQALQDLVVAGCAGYERVVDLYCGLGTFSFPLAAAGHHVAALEGSADMVNAASNAARKAGLEQRIQSSARDLYAKPVPAVELRQYDAAVINPPRNGALPQVKELAKAQIKRIVMVSCNPATFERDAKHLLASGYMLDSLTPVDQFLWSHHLEVVGIFSAVQNIAGNHA